MQLEKLISNSIKLPDCKGLLVDKIKILKLFDRASDAAMQWHD